MGKTYTLTEYKNNILFITNSERSLDTGFIIYSDSFKNGKYLPKMWRKSGKTNNKVCKTDIKTNAKIIVYLANNIVYTKNEILMENLPMNIDKVYFYIENNIYFYSTSKHIKELANKLIFPFGCKVEFISSFDEIKELNKDCQYAIHSFE